MTRARATTAVLLLLLLGFGCRQPGQPPDQPPAPTGDTAGGYGDTLDVRATGTDPDDDSICFRFDWDDGTRSGWTGWVPSGGTATMSHAWASAGTFHVTAQAKDATGQLSDWSDPLAVFILATHSPNPPATPTGPTTTIKDQPTEFTTSAVDPDTDQVSYRFLLGPGDTTEWSQWVPSGQAASVDGYFRRAGTFLVRAQARDFDLVLSGWSAGALSVTVINPQPPNTPTVPRGPAEGGFRETLAFTSTAFDSTEDSVSLRFDWGDGDTSDWTALVSVYEPATGRHVWNRTGWFHVRAQAMDEDGARSGWSDPCSVNITPLIWRYRTGQNVKSSPAIGTDGTIYVGGSDGYLFAINPNGTLKWRYSTGRCDFSSPTIAVDGTVYIGSLDSCLYAVKQNGMLRWRFATGDKLYGSPAIAADATVYAGSMDGYLYAIKQNGTLNWRYNAGADLRSSPAIAAAGTVYFGSQDFYLHAVNPDSSARFRYLTGQSVTSSPAIGSDGTIYFGSDDNYLYALNPDSTLKWRYEAGNDVSSSPAIGPAGTIFFGCRDSCLYAIDAAGEFKWRYRTNGMIESSPAVAADGTVYIGSNDSCLYALSADAGLLLRYRTDGPVTCAPAIGLDGTVYVGSLDGYLYAIAGSSALASSAWPKFRHDARNTGRAGSR